MVMQPDNELCALMERVQTQTEKKDLWKDHDIPEEVANMIVEEAQELVVAVQESMLTGDAFSVASEVGDILYLALKFCSLVDLRPEDTILLKILRNDLKYPTDLNSNGSYHETRAVSQTLWDAIGGDVAFSHAYLQILSSNGHESGKTVTIFNNSEGGA